VRLPWYLMSIKTDYKVVKIEEGLKNISPFID
jgi:glutaredoxin-related protein